MYTWELGKMNMPRSGKTHVQKAPKPSNHTGLISECLPLDGSEVKVTQLCPDSWRPHGLYSPWNSPSQNIGMSRLFLLQGIFPTQRSNPGLPHCRQILSGFVLFCFIYFNSDCGIIIFHLSYKCWNMQCYRSEYLKILSEPVQTIFSYSEPE